MDHAEISAARNGDLPPLDHAEAVRILAAIGDVHAVLVGGQAVNFWARLLEDPGVDTADDLLTSKDIDFEGEADQAQMCAQLLGGEAGCTGRGRSQALRSSSATATDTPAPSAS